MQLTLIFIGTVEDKIKKLAIKRDSTWVEMTGKKLNVLVKQICSVRGHSNWKVRLALAESAGSLLQGCTRSRNMFNKCSPVCCETNYFL